AGPTATPVSAGWEGTPRRHSRHIEESAGGSRSGGSAGAAAASRADGSPGAAGASWAEGPPGAAAASRAEGSPGGGAGSCAEGSPGGLAGSWADGSPGGGAVSGEDIEGRLLLAFLGRALGEPLRLQGEHRPVAAAQPHQLLVAAVLDDRPALHDRDPVD